MQLKIINSFLFCCFFVFASNVNAFEWEYITEMQDRKHFVDTDSINEHSGFRWAYYKSEYPKVQTGSDYNTKKNYSYTSAVTYMAFNCAEKTLVPLSTNYLAEDGKVEHKIRYSSEKAIIEGDKTWELDNNPETFRAPVIEFVCKQKIPK